jgi:hypothetical protein
MTHNIEIKVECKGSAVGTLGWFNSILEKSEFVIKNNQTGIPALFLRIKNETGARDHFICKNEEGYHENYLTSHDGKYIHVAAIENDFVYGLFNFSLTPACRKAVEGLIEKAVATFDEWWKNDGVITE